MNTLNVTKIEIISKQTHKHTSKHLLHSLHRLRENFKYFNLSQRIIRAFHRETYFFSTATACLLYLHTFKHCNSSSNQQHENHLNYQVDEFVNFSFILFITHVRLWEFFFYIRSVEFCFFIYFCVWSEKEVRILFLSKVWKKICELPTRVSFQRATFSHIMSRIFLSLSLASRDTVF